MNLDFSDEQRSVLAEFAKLLSSRNCIAETRRVLEGKAPFDKALWDDLGALGWLGLAIPEEFGGQGLGHELLCGVAEELGRALASVPVGSSIFVVAEALQNLGSTEQKAQWLPRLANGSAIGTMAISETVGQFAGGVIHSVVRNGRLTGRKLAVQVAIKHALVSSPSSVWIGQ